MPKNYHKSEFGLNRNREKYGAKHNVLRPIGQVNGGCGYHSIIPTHSR